MKYRCIYCGHISTSRLGKLWHTLFGWNWLGSAKECTRRG
jgi:hypothetical protein